VYAGIESYIVRLTRRERVNGKSPAQETIKLEFRKQPWSVHLTWLDGEAKGRESIFVKGYYDNKLHTRLAAGDMPLAAAGTRISLTPDSLLVRSASRHAITEAGIGALIERFAALVERNTRGDNSRGSLSYLGVQNRPEFETPVEAVEHLVPAGSEKDLPRGGRRWFYFDSVSHLPLLVVTQDERGQEVEYYCHDRYALNVKLGDDDFNPDKLWGKR
jgi:hypothetical protein